MPPAAAATESIWSHLKDLDIEAAAQEMSSTLSKARKSRLPQHRGSNRSGLDRTVFEPVLDVCCNCQGFLNPLEGAIGSGYPKTSDTPLPPKRRHSPSGTPLPFMLLLRSILCTQNCFRLLLHREVRMKKTWCSMDEKKRTIYTLLKV